MSERVMNEIPLKTTYPNTTEIKTIIKTRKIHTQDLNKPVTIIETGVKRPCLTCQLISSHCVDLNIISSRDCLPFQRHS